MTLGTLNAVWAGTLVDELARTGVREVCLAPGSRSTPLVLAAAEHPDLRLIVHIDERSCAFFALGLARANGRPVAVLTTSGTAAANLLPAVVEASWSEVPLLLLTADRPPELRGADANQAIDQTRLFGGYPREFVDLGRPTLETAALRHLRAVACRAVGRARGEPAGPVHLNVGFAKPLEPPVPRPELPVPGRAGGAPWTRVERRRGAVEEGVAEGLAAALTRARAPVLVAGPGLDAASAAAALRLAQATGTPLLADPLSGARFAEEAPGIALGAYDLVLRDPGVRRTLAPDVVVRLGAAPTSTALQRWLEVHDGVRQVVVDAGHRWKDHGATATDYLHGHPAALLDAVAAAAGDAQEAAWLALWRRLEERAIEVVREELARAPFEGAVLPAVADAVPAGGTLFVSNSMPVRDLDAYVPPRPAPLRVLGNRGASGIDGIVSTVLGIAASGCRPVAVLGDLAFLHDANGLLAAREGMDAVLVVVNNDGGGIFHMLPVREHAPHFIPYFATPHGLEPGRIAAVYGLPYRRVEVAELGGAVAAEREGKGVRILEVRTDREEARERRQEIARAVVDALPDPPVD